MVRSGQAALAFGAVVVLAISRPVGAGAQDVPEAAFADAVRFRAELGLSTDPDLVRSLLDQTDDSRALPFGTPLTPNELALMNRRGEIQEALGPIREYGKAHAADWGGIWLTYPPGGSPERALTLNVNVVRREAMHESALMGLAPEGAVLIIHKVVHTESVLTLAHEPLRAEEEVFFPPLGTYLRLVETNIPENSVDVYLSRVTPAIESAVKARFGSAVVRVFEGGETHPDVCTRLDCGPPWIGGIKIVRLSGSQQFWCTLGFVVRKSVAGGYAYAVWTAGHCGSGTWREGTNVGTQIGTTSFNNAVSPSFADVQVIPISAANRTNKIIDDSAGCSNCNLRSFTAQQAYEADEFGDTVCNNGYVSGQRCGLIRSTNVDHFVYKGVDWNNQRRATYVRDMGDSGGPVFTTVKGHLNLPVGGHPSCPQVATEPARWWPSKLPGEFRRAVDRPQAERP